MSSRNEVSDREAGFGPEDREHVSAPLVGPGAPGGLFQDSDLGPLQNNEDKSEGSPPGPRSQECDLGSEPDVIVAGGLVFQGHGDQSVSHGKDKGDGLDFVPHLNVEATSISQQIARATGGTQSPKSCTSNISAIWADAEAGPSGRGTLALSCVEAQEASAAPHHPRGPGRGRVWKEKKKKKKKGTKSKRMDSEDAQQPSDPESSDEFSEIPVIRVTITWIGGDGAKCSSPKTPGDTARHSNVRATGNMLGPLLTSAPWGLASAVEKQAPGELETSSSKKKQSVVWGKGGSRPSYPAAASSLPRARHRKKVAQEKKSLEVATNVTMGRAFPSRGLGIKAAPLEPATLPPISGVPPLERSKRNTLVPVGPKQLKHDGSGMRPVVRRTGESQAVAREDNGPNMDPMPQAQAGNMSSPDEVPVWTVGVGPEDGERAVVRLASSGARAPRGPGLGLDPGPSHSGEGEGEGEGEGKGEDEDEDERGRRGSKGCEFESGSELEVIEAGRMVLWGCEGRPGSPVDEKGDALDLVPHLRVEPAGTVQQLTDVEARSVRRHPSAGSCAVAETGPRGRGALARSCVGALRASAAPCPRSGPERGRAWANPRRGTTSRAKVSEEAQRPSSDPESSDEFSEIQLIRVSIGPKDGGQAKCSSPKAPGDTARHSSVPARENFLHLPGPLLTSAPRGLASAVEKQATGELEASSSKKKQSVVWGKEGSRPSYPGVAAAAAAAAAGSLPRASPRKVAQGKSLGSASGVTLGRSFPSWGQRFKAPPLEPATFPPILGVPLLGRSTTYSSAPSGSKHGDTRKRSVARRTRESQPVARKDDEPNRDPVLQAQLPTHRPEPVCLCMRHGEFSSGDPSTRPPQVPGNSRPLDLNLGDTMPRGPAPSGDWEPPVHPPVPERQQQAPGAPGCLRCLMLQKERDDLKEQLAVMQSFTDKFQAL